VGGHAIPWQAAAKGDNRGAGKIPFRGLLFFGATESVMVRDRSSMGLFTASRPVSSAAGFIISRMASMSKPVGFWWAGGAGLTRLRNGNRSPNSLDPQE